MMESNPPAKSNQPQGESILNNVEILENIFRHCPIEEQKIIRSLSKKVYKDSLQYWRRNTPVLLEWCSCYNQKSGKECEYQQKSGLHNFHQILSFIFLSPPLLQLSTIPYRKFNLFQWNFRLRESDSSTTFLPTIGPHVLELQITEPLLQRNRQLRNSFFKRFPNLVKLTIRKGQWLKSVLQQDNLNSHTFRCENLRILELYNSEIVENGFRGLLQHFPNIEELKVEKEPRRTRNCATGKALRQILNVLQELRAGTAGGYNLKRLDLMDTVFAAIRCDAAWRVNHKLTQFTSARFPLTHLTIDLGVRTTALAINTVLIAHQDTLEVLKCFREPIDDPVWSFGTGVEMNSMKELHIWGAVTPHFGFLKGMPNLKIFKLERSCYKKKHKTERSLKTKYFKEWNSCYVENTKKFWARNRNGETREDGSAVGKNLETFAVDFEFGKENVKAISRWMPNLKKIKFIVNEDSLKVVVRKWPNLCGFTMLHGSTLSDGGVVNELAKLKKLKKFKLETACERSLLGDGSVQKGFLEMPDLESMDICVSPDMSDQSEILLGEHVKKLIVRRNYGEGHNDECCKRHEYNLKSIVPARGNGIELRSRRVDTPNTF